VQASNQGIDRETLGRRCDFCGDQVMTVRRVALDREYDRLQTAHQVLYSCSNCFENKERQRLGLTRR
jgi:hypothetical protein